jgi:hypothetical protein
VSNVVPIKPVKLRYLVITNGEGGATYENLNSLEDFYDSWDRLPKEKRDEIYHAELGDEITLDGCSDLFILKAEV